MPISNNETKGVSSGRHHVNLSNRDPHRTSSWRSGTHMSLVNTNERQKPLCVRAPQMWNQSPVDLRTIGSFSCFKTELKQYLVMSGSCHNYFNDVILVLSQFIVCIYMFLAYRRSCLKMGFQLHLQPQLTNQSRHVCMFLNPTAGLYTGWGCHMYAPYISCPRVYITQIIHLRLISTSLLSP